MEKRGHLETLDQWASWGRLYAPPQPKPNWSAVELLIEAARPRLLDDSRALRELLERSARRLKLTDPLLCDLGVHRWLSKDREESYSDWLAWVLEQLADANAVLRILGVRKPEFVSTCAGQTCHIEREACLEDGRIDLLIHFGEPVRALLGVEVRTSDEEYKKQQGYMKSLRKLCPQAECVLVANIQASQERLHGFKLRRWRDLSIALRQAIAGYVQSRRADAVAAMMLGFAGAIEQNLLELGTTAARRAHADQPGLVPAALLTYLKEALEVRP